MPRYYFNHSNGVVRYDRDGLELPSETDARAHAIRALETAVTQLGDALWNSPELEVWATNESGITICSITLMAKSSAPVVLTEALSA